MKKYEITDIAKQLPNGTIVHRVRALRDLPTYYVKAGTLGGWIESEYNLSHDGDCWVADDAIVTGDAMVSDNAIVCDMATVSNDAEVRGGSCVRQEAEICDSACISEYAVIGGRAIVGDNAYVMHHADVGGCSIISGDAHIGGYAYVHGADVSGHANIYDDAQIYSYAHIYGDVDISGHAVIYDKAIIYGKAIIGDNASIGGDAIVSGYSIIAGHAMLTQGHYTTNVISIYMIPDYLYITPNYPHHAMVGYELIDISNKRKAIKAMNKCHNVPPKLYNQVWASMKLCKKWLKDNPERTEKDVINVKENNHASSI